VTQSQEMSFSYTIFKMKRSRQKNTNLFRSPL